MRAARCPSEIVNVLLLTDRGSTLIADSVDSVNELESEFQVILGSSALQQLRSISKELFLALELEAPYSEPGKADIPQLARQLKLCLSEQALNKLVLLLQTG